MQFIMMSMKASLLWLLYCQYEETGVDKNEIGGRSQFKPSLED